MTPNNRTTGANPAGVTTGPGGTYLRDTRGRGVEDRVNSLLRSDSDYMQINERSGQNFAARRGLLNSSLAAQAGRQGAVAGALPIAQADAQLQAQADAQNAESMNQVTLANLARDTAAAGARGDYTGHDEIARMNFEREQNALDREQRSLDRTQQRDLAVGGREFESLERSLDRGLTREQWNQQQEQAALDRGLTREEWDVRREQWGAQRAESDAQRGWQSNENALGRTFSREMTTAEGRQQMFANVMSQSLGTIFSSPDFFNDPASASGFLEFFTGQFGSLFDRFFGPGGP